MAVLSRVVKRAESSVTHLHVFLVMVVSVQFGLLKDRCLWCPCGDIQRLGGGGVRIALCLLLVFHLALLSAVVTLLLLVVVPGHLQGGKLWVRRY